MFTDTAQNLAVTAATFKFYSSCNTPGHTSKPRIVLTLQPHSNIPPPEVPPIAHPNRESCSRCSYTQIIILRGTPEALGGVLHKWVAKHKFWAFVFAELERGELEVLKSWSRNHELFVI